jgi:hypothetical protein
MVVLCNMAYYIAYVYSSADGASMGYSITQVQHTSALQNLFNPTAYSRRTYAYFTTITYLLCQNHCCEFESLMSVAKHCLLCKRIRQSKWKDCGGGILTNLGRSIPPFIVSILHSRSGVTLADDVEDIVILHVISDAYYMSPEHVTCHASI